MKRTGVNLHGILGRERFNQGEAGLDVAVNCRVIITDMDHMI
jgi:hypothetical protein